MEELIINLIQTGAYSAVFAALLVYVISAAAKRERFYRTFISELCVSLKQIGEVGGKVDELLRIAEAATRRKKPGGQFTMHNGQCRMDNAECTIKDN